MHYVQKTINKCRLVRDSALARAKVADATITYLESIIMEEGSGEEKITATAAGTIANSTTRKTRETRKTASRRPARSKSSEYTGVSRGKPRADGTPVWKAMAWDGEKKKVKHLGCSHTEELAAAMVADYRGDKEEGVRLRRLAREKQRPPTPAELAAARGRGEVLSSNDMVLV